MTVLRFVPRLPPSSRAAPALEPLPSPRVPGNWPLLPPPSPAPATVSGLTRRVDHPGSTGCHRGQFLPWTCGGPKDVRAAQASLHLPRGCPEGSQCALPPRGQRPGHRRQRADALSGNASPGWAAGWVSRRGTTVEMSLAGTLLRAMAVGAPAAHRQRVCPPLQRQAEGVSVRAAHLSRSSR